MNPDESGNTPTEPKPETVVLVDDEKMVLTSLRSILTLETDYRVETFTSAGEAIEFVRGNDVGIVISDYLMPEMDGLSFLAEIREIKPEIPRIILTGYADKENAIKAINEVGLYYYIEKPWNNDELMVIVRNGIEKQKLLRQLQEKIGEIDVAYGDLRRMQRDILKTFI